jgi:hypothetical protein
MGSLTFVENCNGNEPENHTRFFAYGDAAQIANQLQKGFQGFGAFPFKQGDSYRT